MWKEWWSAGAGWRGAFYYCGDGACCDDGFAAWLLLKATLLG